MDIRRRNFLGASATLLGAAALFGPRPLCAEESDGVLTIAFSLEPSAIDPHWHIVSQNSSLSQHIFDRLVHSDPNQLPVPGLASAWRNVDELTWEFDLRPDARFHNGDPLTPEDIVFSYERAQNVPGAIFNMRTYLADKTVEKVGDHAIRIRTAKPNPIVLNELATTAIVSARVGRDAVTADYNSGKAAIGTGPYRFVENVPGERIVLERNDDYWGEKPEWRRVVIRPVPNGGARVAALLSGGVNVIDNVPPSDVAKLEADAGLSLTKSVTNRVVFLSFDQGRETSPFVAAKDGGPLRNVFLDRRVREAVSLAIDKQAIAARILEGNGQAASQFVPPGIFGHNDQLPVNPADPDRARALLQEAGLPDGFRVTLHGPNDRFIRDAAVVQAVAQMLTRVGIRTEVDVMPGNVFYQRATSGGPEDGSQFSFFLVGYGAATGEASGALRNVVHTVDKQRGFGSNNRTRYSNPEIDAIIEKGMTTIDDAERAALFQQATQRAIEDVAVVPLYYPVTVWALRKPVRYPGRSDERTLATEIRS